MRAHHPVPAFTGLLLLVCLAVGLTACGSGSSAHSRAPSSHAAAPPAATSQRVQISGFAFHPATASVAKDARITFSNQDQTAHTATSSRAGVFDTGTLNPGQSRTVVLKKAGTYTYYCQFHAFMRATIIVR